jgi:polar amino acid transport system substrate-binding protein
MPNLRARALLLLGIATLVPVYAAEPLKLATGEYAPFTSEALAGGGPLAEMVRRAFAVSGTEVNISFLPWKRSYSETLKGKYDGTFPYGRNAERERDFYFSESYFTVDRRMYYRADSGLKPEDTATLKGKKYCLPLGFVLFKELGAMVENKSLGVQSPADLASCAKMLQLNRVDFFIATPDIAETAMAKAGLRSNAFASQTVGKSENFLVVPKTHPRGQEIISTFNKGIATLRSKGELDRISKSAHL